MKLKRDFFYLLVIVIFGAALRLVAIEQQPLWGDEGLTLLIAQRPAIDFFLTPEDPTPGLYYLLHKVFVGPDAGLFAARSISLIAGIATIAATFACARASNIPSVSSAALTALSFSLIDFSVEARAYSLLILLVVLSAWAFVSWTRRRRRSALVSFIALLILSFYTHFVAVFWIAPMVVAAFQSSWRDTESRRQLAWGLCLAVILTIPELNRLASYPPEAFSWLKQVGVLDALNLTGLVLLPFGFFENDNWHIGRSLTATTILAIYVMIGWRGFAHRIALRRWAAQNPGGAAIVLVYLTLPITIWLFGYVAKPVFISRTILFCAPGFFMALCLILKHDHRYAPLAITGFYACNLILMGLTRPKEDWRSIAVFLEANVQSGDVVILCPSWKAMAFRHSLRAGIDAPLLLVSDKGVFQIERKLGSSRYWARAYFRTLQENGGFEEARTTLRDSKRVWRINSTCPTK